jgi:hypothetical protein
MNEANTMEDITGVDLARETAYFENFILGFCGFLTADIPELHGIHPQAIADSWERYKARIADGFEGLHFDEPEHHENGDGVG